MFVVITQCISYSMATRGNKNTRTQTHVHTTHTEVFLINTQKYKKKSHLRHYGTLGREKNGSLNKLLMLGKIPTA